MNKEKLKQSYWILHLTILFVVVGAIWFFSYFVLLDKFSTWGERGVFGDSFGAVNSLFSGLAFAGIIYTIFLQRKEFELQRIELTKSVEAQEKSSIELANQVSHMRATARLNALSTMVSYLNDKESKAKNETIAKQVREQRQPYLEEIKEILKDNR